MDFALSAKRGMTLIELLLVLAIIGLLSAITLPSYEKYLHQAKRHAAQSELYKLQIWLEQKYTAELSYPKKLNCVECQLSEEYDFSINVAEDGNGYQLMAKPKSNSSLSKDKCFTQVLNHLSQQSNLDKEGKAVKRQDCWR